MKRRAAQRGFTLVELMIALVLFSVAILGVLSVAVSMTRAFREQRRVVATENAVRAPMDFLVDVVRGASPAVPNPANIWDAATCRQGAILLTDHPDPDNGTDTLEVVYASGGIVTTLHSALVAGSTSLTSPDVHAAEFAVGDYALVSNGTQGVLLKVTGTTVASPEGTITFAAPGGCAAAFAGNPYPAAAAGVAGAILVRAQRASFTVGSVDGIPTLMMDPDGPDGADPAEPVAEGIEDLQVALGVDTDASRSLTDTSSTADEWQGNAIGDVALVGSTRAVRIVLVARENLQLPGEATFYRPTALNRNGGTSPDGYRRRVLSSTVEIRNLTGSPGSE